VATIVGSMFAALERHAPRATRVLVLGAGAGRFAFELTARVGEVIAIDRSVPMAASVQLLRERPQRLYEIHERNVERIDDHVRAFDVSIPACAENGATFDRMRYVVGDALSVPLLSHSVSAIVSVYFTDVVSPTLLFSEAARLLEPGGLFFHFGPLQYHFSGPREQLSAHEMKQLLNECGYEIVEEQWVPLSCLASDLSMCRPEIRNWSMSAVLTPDARCASDEVRDLDVLSICAEPLLQARWRRSGTAARWIDGSVVSMWGHEVPLTEAAFDVLRLVDGRRTVAELFDLAKTNGATERDRPVIRDALTRLKRIGVVSVSNLRINQFESVSRCQRAEIRHAAARLSDQTGGST
jgi:carnosine N-methyltransferase